MKISRKLRFEISMAAHRAMVAVLERQFPDTYAYPPETWNDEQRRLFDLATEVGDAVEKGIVETISPPDAAQ